MTSSGPPPDPLDAPAQFYRRVLSVLRSARVPFLVGGTYAFTSYTGIGRRTKDIDLFVRPEDCDAALEALKADGFGTQKPYPHWLAKAHYGEDFVDVIYRSGNGLSAVDDGWFERAAEGEVLGVPVLLCPPEEVLWTKAFIMERERYDGADVAHLLLAAAPRLDWKLLLYRFGDDWRVLLAHLVLFGYIFPSERNRVPREVMEVLLARLAHEVAEPPPFERVCQGTLLSRGQYLVDVEERGFEDGRLRPDVEMTAEDIAHWTSAIPEADRPTQRLVGNGDGASPSARSPGSAPPVLRWPRGGRRGRRSRRA
ncbi:MAG TPA: nucleotidyltransferase family protein [Rubricoccaceae bacterium]|nr:nucleotidyltransferase family protein [Rubricoccaceae bacterium]